MHIIYGHFLGNYIQLARGAAPIASQNLQAGLFERLRRTGGLGHQRLVQRSTVAVTAKVAELKRQGREVIGLGAGEPDLLSFAAITDTPPPEIAAAGHDRCVVPIKRQNVDAWLRPVGDLTRSYAILDDRERPYYEHRVAA